LNLEGATYHVMARGNRKQVIFDDDRDRRRFLAILDAAADRYGVMVLAYCLMGSHFHLIVTTPRGNLSTFMRQVDGCFTQYSNWRHQRVGHLLQGPFKAVVVEGNAHLLTALAYLLRNPVESGAASTPADWKWSSYRCTVGRANSSVSLDLTWLGCLFPAPSQGESRQLFDRFMRGLDTTDDVSANGPVIGSDDFRRRLRAYIGETLFHRRVPRSYKALFRPALEDLFSGIQDKHERAKAIQRAHVLHGYTLSEIADALALHPASVSRINCDFRKETRARLEGMLKNGT